MRGILILAALMVVVLACTEAGANADCKTPQQSVVNAITEGLETGSLRGAMAVKSTDFANVWFVAADIQRPGLDGTDDVAIWAIGGDVTSPSWKPSGIFSADAMAREFSNWGTPNTLGGPSDHGYRESRDCAEATLG